MTHLVVYIYQAIYILYSWKIPIIPKLLSVIIVRLIFSCQISLGAKLGKNVTVGLGVAIHPRAVIGDNVSIAQGVTIGGRSKKYDVPIIGNGCHIGPGAKILGPIKLGENVIVGANAVVIHDVSSNSVVAGIPAKIIKANININDYK